MADGYMLSEKEATAIAEQHTRHPYRVNMTLQAEQQYFVVTWTYSNTRCSTTRWICRRQVSDALMRFNCANSSRTIRQQLPSGESAQRSLSSRLQRETDRPRPLKEQHDEVSGELSASSQRSAVP